METLAGRHLVEKDVQTTLESHPAYRFSDLVVHRISDGVCLTGVVDVNDDAPDVEAVAQQISGVERVLNQLVTCGKGRVR
ncbi:BON domain-containing protein [Stratiformator vulcanicus]|nr:BON domain-containing protein [Stratiformator vulcanicus]